MPDNVKCTECGFYSRRRISDSELVCVDEIFRNEPSFTINDPTEDFEAMPVCAMRVPDFWDEGDFEEAVNRDRSCDKFTPWMPAYSPREHAEMIRDAQMQKWQEAQSDKANYRANLSLAVAIGGILIAAGINLAGIVISNNAPNVTVVMPDNSGVTTKAAPGKIPDPTH